MEKIRNSNLLKLLCYILIPIIVASFILSIIYVNLKGDYNNLGIKKEEYLQSEDFADQYISDIIRNVYRIGQGYTTIENNGFYDKIDEHIYYDRTYYNNNVTASLKFVIINNNTNDIYTNLKSNDYNEIIKEFNKKEIYWNYENGNIDTNIEKINKDNIKYMDLPINGLDTIENFNVYTYLDKSSFTYSNTFEIRNILFDTFNKNPNLADV